MKCLVGELPVYYEIRGTGRPILMIHGFGPDHRLMLGCMEPIFNKRTGWRRIYFDLPGMGQTPGPEWISNSDQMLDVVRWFVDQVLPLEHYCVAGESYGGYLAQGLAARYPDRIEGLFLLCSLVHADPARRRVPKHVVLEREPGLLERLTDEERAEFEPIGVIQTSATWEKMKRDVLPGLAARDQPFLDRLWATGYPIRGRGRPRPRVVCQTGADRRRAAGRHRGVRRLAGVDVALPARNLRRSGPRRPQRSDRTTGVI